MIIMKFSKPTPLTEIVRLMISVDVRVDISQSGVFLVWRLAVRGTNIAEVCLYQRGGANDYNLE